MPDPIFPLWLLWALGLLVGVPTALIALAAAGIALRLLIDAWRDDA